MGTRFVAGGLCGVVASLGACGPVGPFACETDVQCLAGEKAGICEPGGYCSFDDGDCPSGRRYGDHAPADTANACVPLDVESTGSSASTGGIGDEGLDGLDGGLETTDPGSTSASGSVGEEGSTEDGGSTSNPSGEGSSTGAVEGCSVVLDDTFEDASFDADWVATDPEISQRGGELWVPIDTTFASQKYVMSAERYDLVGGSYTVEMGTPPDSPLPVVWVDVEDDIHRTQFVLIGEDLRVRLIVTDQDITDYLIVDHDPVAHRFLRIGFEPGDLVQWSVSPDGEAWTELHSEPIPLDATAARVRLAAGNWSDLQEPQIVGYERATVCVAER